jgi:hypothetical protein
LVTRIFYEYAAWSFSLCILLHCPVSSTYMCMWSHMTEFSFTALNFFYPPSPFFNTVGTFNSYSLYYFIHTILSHYLSLFPHSFPCLLLISFISIYSLFFILSFWLFEPLTFLLSLLPFLLLSCSLFYWGSNFTSFWKWKTFKFTLPSNASTT